MADNDKKDMLGKNDPAVLDNGVAQDMPSPPPDLTAEEAATLAHESGKALHDIGEEQLEPPAPFDIGGEYIPDPGDPPVSASKSKPHIVGIDFPSGKKIGIEETEKPAPDKKTDAPEKTKGRGRPPKAAEAEKPAGDKPKPRAPKEKAAAGADKSDKKDKKAAPAKEKTTPPAPKQPAEPREAPRANGTEQIGTRRGRGRRKIPIR